MNGERAGVLWSLGVLGHWVIVLQYLSPIRSAESTIRLYSLFNFLNVAFYTDNNIQGKVSRLRLVNFSAVPNRSTFCTTVQISVTTGEAIKFDI